MTPLVFSFPGHEELARRVASRLEGETGELALRAFPDGESYVRLDAPVRGRPVVLVCGLHRPNEKLLPLAFAADAARDLGASGVGLIAPYLAYLRQDARFREGEAITSASFAGMVSRLADWLVTVEPHLHRLRSLADVYSIPAEAVRAGPAIAAWIRARVERPLLVGPDSESEQWVADVAQAIGAPHVVLEKTRRGDRDVEVSLPELDAFRDRVPVLVDDIISTARTMIAAVRRLRQAGMPAPICVGVHAVFAGTAYQELLQSGAAEIATCNTIAHPSNAIDLDESIAEASCRLADRSGSDAVRPRAKGAQA